jgi:hypothetical protein
MVGSTIPYSPFERAVTRPKLNAIQYHYGVGSNFITGAPPEVEDLLTLQLCMKSKFNDPKCVISKQGFTHSDLPAQLHNETSIRMCWYQNAQIPITGNGHASTGIGISTCTGTCPYQYWDSYLEMHHHPHFILF